MPELLRGHAVLTLCGWAVLPLVLRLFRPLPDRGYALCRLVGWVVAGWIAWTASWLSGRPLSTSLALASIALAGLACWLPVLARRRRRPDPTGRGGGLPPPAPPRRLGPIVWIETLFLAGTLLFGALQARNPAIDPDSERFMDYALLQACLRSPGPPVMDPWMAGREGAYYHFGYALVAFLVRAAGSSPGAFFTAAIALVHALLWIGAFGLGLLLTGRPRGGLWAAILVLGAGNLQWIRQGTAVLRPGAFDWFAPSRVIEGTITEFPWFSLLWGDLHPYVVALPMIAAALACVLAEVQSERTPEPPPGTASDGAVESAGRAAAFALLAGAVLATHPWDFPPLLLASLALVLSAGPGRRALRMVATIVAGVLSGLLFLPFLRGLAWGGRGLARVAETSAPSDWLLAYGPFVLLAVVASAFAPWRDRPAGAGPARARGERDSLALAAAALALALLCEIVYVRDLFEATPLRRMNTVFKLHRIAWLFLGLAAAPHIERLLARGAGLRRAVARALVLAVLAIALAGPAAGTAAWLRAREREAGREEDRRVRAALRPGADAEALFRARFPGDAGAAAFLSRAAGPRDAVLEETGEPYTWSARVSTFSGVPAVLGWGNHEAVWRQGWDEVLRRSADVEAIYREPGWQQACDRLSRYGVRWIVVGDRERRRYGEAASRFARAAAPAFADRGTEIYLAGDLCGAGRP